MQALFIIAIVIAAGLVLFSLVRGLIYFGQVHNADGPEAMELHLKQNQMMFNRVKWQAVTVILLIVVGLLAAGGSN